MAYHVSLVNTEDNSHKLIFNKNDFRDFLLKEFNMQESLDEHGQLEFYYDKEDESFTIFYTEGIEGEYYINTTDDEHIEKLIAIANKLNDGTRVRGDEGETYLSLEEVYIHPDDIQVTHLSLMDRFKRWVRRNTCIIIWACISISLLMYKIITRG
jgi:raw score 2.75